MKRLTLLDDSAISNKDGSKGQLKASMKDLMGSIDKRHATSKLPYGASLCDQSSSESDSDEFCDGKGVDDSHLP